MSVNSSCAVPTKRIQRLQSLCRLKLHNVPKNGSQSLKHCLRSSQRLSNVVSCNGATRCFKSLKPSLRLTQSEHRSAINGLLSTRPRIAAFSRKPSHVSNLTKDESSVPAHAKQAERLVGRAREISDRLGRDHAEDRRGKGKSIGDTWWRTRSKHHSNTAARHRLHFAGGNVQRS